jgi:hypothetical protein
VVQGPAGAPRDPEPTSLRSKPWQILESDNHGFSLDVARDDSKRAVEEYPAMMPTIRGRSA